MALTKRSTEEAYSFDGVLVLSGSYEYVNVVVWALEGRIHDRYRPRSLMSVEAALSYDIHKLGLVRNDHRSDKTEMHQSLPP